MYNIISYIILLLVQLLNYLVMWGREVDMIVMKFLGLLYVVGTVIIYIPYLDMKSFFAQFLIEFVKHVY